MLEREPADLPELLRDLGLLVGLQAAPPAALGEGLVDVLVDERQLTFSNAGRRVPVHDVDARGAVVAQQRGPLVGALPAADDRDPGAGQVVERHQVAGVRRVGSSGTAVVPVRQLREEADAGCGEHLVGLDRAAVVHGGDEGAVRPGEVDDQARVGAQRLVVGEPLGVVEPHVDRDRVVVGRVEPAVLEERLEGVLAVGVEVPVGAGAQVHVGRHLVAPEGERPPDDGGVDVAVAGVRRRGVRVGPRADDEQVRPSVRHGGTVRRQEPLRTVVGMTRVAIVGGHGQVARQLIHVLRRADHDAVALVRKEEYRAELEGRGAEVRLLDIETQDVDAFAAAFEGCGAVVFAAGGGPDGNIERKRTVDLEGSLKSIAGAKKAGIDRFVQISAINVDDPLPEDTGDVWRAYVEAKRDADAALRDSGLAWTIIRPGPAHRRPGHREGLTRPGRGPR